MVYLLHTDTALCRCYSGALKEYLQGKGVRAADLIEVVGLHGDETFQRGLANLILKTTEIMA